MKETNIERKKKLNLDQINELKQKRNKGETIENLAATYGISRISVYNYIGRAKINSKIYQKFLPTGTINLRNKFLYGKFDSPLKETK